jgi:hypothetical protein
MKKIVFALILLSGIVAALFLYESEDLLPSSLESYKPLEFLDSIEATPDDNYTTGAFCRFYYEENRDEFLLTFGTGHGQAGGESYVGGGEGGQGAAYKFYNKDLEESDETGYYMKGGGDLATMKVGDYLYHLTGGPDGWRLKKFDVNSWEEIDEKTIKLGDDEGANDQMLVYVNGMLIGSSAYAENANVADTAGNEDNKIDPSVGIYTHHHSFDLSMKSIDSWIFEDVRHTNGSSMVFVDGVYSFVTGTAFFGDLQVLRYDEDWNFIDSKLLIESAQWPQGTVYDEENERYYVAYLGIGEARSEVSLAVFDKDWELLSNTLVTDYGDEFFAGRPSVTVYEDKVYLTYDKETRNEETNEWNKDWQCQIGVYEKME